MAPKFHEYQIRVRYAEIDRMGVVYHSRYIEWFEAARTEMLRDRGLTYKQMEADGILLPVIEVNCRYLKSVFYDDLVTITTQVQEANRLKIRLFYQVYVASDKVTHADGYSLHCFVNSQGRPSRVDQRVVDFFLENFD